MLWCAADSRSVLQGVAVCCSVLRCVAVTGKMNLVEILNHGTPRLRRARIHRIGVRSVFLECIIIVVRNPLLRQKILGTQYKKETNGGGGGRKNTNSK